MVSKFKPLGINHYTIERLLRAEHCVMVCGLGEHIYKAVSTLKRAGSRILSVFKDQRNELKG